MTNIITGTYNTLVTLGLLSDNLTTITAAGLLDGGLLVIYQDLTIVNAGSVTNQSGVGIFLNESGNVTNQSSGTINGTDGIYGWRAAVDVVNAASIEGAQTGVYLYGGGSVANQSGGVISGGLADGIVGGHGALTVVNAGSIAGSGYGVLLHDGGRVTNQSGGVIIADNGIVSGAVDHAVAVVNAGSIVATGYGIIINNGSVTNQSGGVISGRYGIRGAALTVVNAGTIVGSSYAVRFDTSAWEPRLIAEPGAVFVGNVDGAGGVLELGSAASAGTLSGLGSTITNFEWLQFDAGAAWTVSGSASDSGLSTIAIKGFASGDTFDLTGFVAADVTFANNGLVLSSASNAHATLNVQGTFAPDGFQISSDGNGGTDIIVCFAVGTRISTPIGEVLVQDLAIGDLVLTAHNGPRNVAWIGKGKVLATRGRRTAATPVIVRQHALADNVPNRDLHVTKAHSLYIDDVLIPVEFLVNHRTILWDDRAREVEIYHIELDSHDVLIANGAPAESFRDDGNRWLFQNARSGWNLPPQEPYAPVLTGGPIVDAAWRRLLNRAGPRALPPLTDDPDLHLLVDGTRVDALEPRGSVYAFRLPSRPGSMVIASRKAVPSELGVARDPRSLGVALRRVTVQQGARFMQFNADDKRLTEGFHAYEADCNLRWTNGHAELPTEAFARFDTGAQMTLYLGGATQYLDERVCVVHTAA